MLSNGQVVVKKLLASRKSKLLVFGSGIFVSYAILGILQERIFRGRYGTDIQENGEIGEVFKFPVAFVALQSIVYTFFAKAVILVCKTPANETNQKFFFFFGIFCVSASVTAYMSLVWITYSTQVVAKASKPIFVMFMSVLFGRKRYSAQKYFFVFVTVLGIGSFVFKECQRSQRENIVIGYCLIVLSLVMDGLTGAIQDRMRSSNKPSWINFMYFNNGWSSCILIAILAVTGEGRDFISFTMEHPQVSWHSALAIVVGTGGEVCISMMVANFGSLPLSLVSLTRMFCTVLLSALIYGNDLTIRQWVSTAVVFGALLLDAVFSKKKKDDENSAVQEIEAKDEASQDGQSDIAEKV